MAIKEIDKTQEYTFNEAWKKVMEDSNVIITSKNSGDSYKLDKFEKKNKLKFHSSTIAAWQSCPYILTVEMLDMWYVTKGQIVN